MTASQTDDAVSFEDALNLYDFEVIQGGHVTLHLAKAQPLQLGSQVFAGHLIVLGELVNSFLAQSWQVSRVRWSAFRRGFCGVGGRL